MAADKQYADAKRALKIIEQFALVPGAYLTYGDLARRIGYTPMDYGRHIGQVCSLIDAACFWAKLPVLSLEKVRLDGGDYNLESFSGIWAGSKDVLISNAAAKRWSPADVEKLIRTLDVHMNGEGAIRQWARINAFGDKAVQRLASYK